jgi:hypothetical protein
MLTYKSKIGSNEIIIEYNIVNNEAWMEYINYKPEYIKSFIILLEQSVKDLIERKIEKLVQTVKTSEWNEYLKSDESWKVKSEMKQQELTVIECDIKEATVAILRGYGMK